MGYIHTGNLLTSVLYNQIYLFAGGFLCFYTVKEHLRYRWATVLIPLFLTGIVYGVVGYFFAWFGLVYMLFAFFYFYHVTHLPYSKLVVVFLLTTNFLYLVSVIIQMFSINHLFMLLFLPLFAWLMRNKLWSAMHAMGTTEFRVLMPLTFVLTILSILFCSSYIMEVIRPGWQYLIIVCLFTTVTFSAYYLMLVMLHKTMENARVQEQVRYVDAQLLAQTARYREISTYTKEVKVMRHDMRHHFLLLTGMLRDKKYSEAENYLQEYTGQNESMEQPLCEHYAVDVIARRYRAEANRLGIQTDFCISLPQNPGIADTDLCIVLGNLIENSIHAASKAEGEKLLHVIIKVQGAEILIAVDNTCKAREGTMQAIPGLGMLSVQAIAQKYGGMAKFDDKGDWFVATVLMYAEEELPFEKSKLRRI